MNKMLWVSVIAVILLAVGATAQVVLPGLSNDIKNATVNIPIKPEPTRFSGNITFTVNGKGTGFCYLNEPNMEIDDDFEACIEAKYPGKTITKAKDWTGRYYQEITIKNTTIRSFDSAKLEALQPEEDKNETDNN